MARIRSSFYNLKCETCVINAPNIESFLAYVLNCFVWTLDIIQITPNAVMLNEWRRSCCYPICSDKALSASNLSKMEFLTKSYLNIFNDLDSFFHFSEIEAGFYRRLHKPSCGPGICQRPRPSYQCLQDSSFLQSGECLTR